MGPVITAAINTSFSNHSQFKVQLGFTLSVILSRQYFHELRRIFYFGLNPHHFKKQIITSPNLSFNPDPTVLD